MSRACCLVLFASAIVACLEARAAEVYVIDPTHTTPLFEVAHLSGMSRQFGFFTNAMGRITLDLAARTGTIEAEIGTGSVVTAGRVLTDVLKRADYLDADHYPVMRYVARDIAFDGDVPVRADGELTLLGVTRPVALAITEFHCGTHPLTRRPMCGARATATLRRSEFGMTAGLPWAAGDEVRIVIPVEATQE